MSLFFRLILSCLGLCHGLLAGFQLIEDRPLWTGGAFADFKVRHYRCPNMSADKLTYQRNRVVGLCRAKIALDFPDRCLSVEFPVSAQSGDLHGYQLSFWQSD
ncbi:hypothetical protein [Oryzibacter oryziterrae]|uniref:hypothetical protein n=1 Tax=Oryzibacter oryziterrae TaxID=2766474 RepID=UPI001F292C70|nr:hypothetical protein [Oryzibacter oryziterrae]